MPSDRRTVVASVGLALAGVAGCTDRNGSDTPPSDRATPTSTASGSPADRTLGDTVTLDGTTVTVAELAAAHSYHYRSAPDAFGVESAGDGQFVFVGVTARGDDTPPVRQFALELDGERVVPSERTRGPVRDLAPVRQGRYTADDPEGYLLFPVPAPLDAESVAVLLGEGPRVTDSRTEATDVRARWTIPDATLDPLRSPPPAFTVAYDVPDAVGRDEPVPLRLDVTNEGDGAGVFRGALNHTGPMYGGDTFSVALDPGASTAYEESIDYHVGEHFSVDRLQFEVVVPGDSRSFTVALEGSSTATGTP
ncbi:MAG: hypothetical protein ABEJ73_11770 [Haloplanus sp.]